MIFREDYFMNRALSILGWLFALLFLAGCNQGKYEFKHPVGEIEKIEIVSAENSRSYSVKKTLSENEKSEFIDKFQKIKFDKYYIGDPMSVSGTAVRIAYQNGDYEIICHYWSEYVKNGNIYYIRKSCDEKEFNKLLNQFY